MLFRSEAGWGTHSRWLTCITVDAEAFGATREDVRIALEEQNVESRPIWKPMHLQPVFQGSARFGGQVAERIFDDGLCLPSGSQMTEEHLARVVATVRACARSA